MTASIVILRSASDVRISQEEPSIPRPRREAGEGLRENWFARQIARTEGANGISAEMPAIELLRMTTLAVTLSLGRNSMG